jgi:hypothetical protein
MKCTTGMYQADQEHKAMVETAHRLYEAFSQKRRVSPDHDAEHPREDAAHGVFVVTREAAEFATEVHIHHMCTVWPT